MSKDQFFAFIDARPSERWELIDGVPVMMVGATLKHALIVQNVVTALKAVAGPRGCNALQGDPFVTGSDGDTFLAVPDIYVYCGSPDQNARILPDPTIIVEVLSPSTMVRDRGLKLERYQAMPSVRQVLLVYQNEVRVESWTRREGTDADGLGFEHGVARRLDEAARLPSLDAALPLHAVYAGIDGLQGLAP
jgi:Uma2 family endonuclease